MKFILNYLINGLPCPGVGANVFTDFAFVNPALAL
jgi:hypothetical protein